MELDQVHIELAPKAGNINQLRAEADAFRAGRIVKREADLNPRPRWVRPRVVFTVIVVVVIGLFMVGTGLAAVGPARWLTWTTGCCSVVILTEWALARSDASWVYPGIWVATQVMIWVTSLGDHGLEHDLSMQRLRQHQDSGAEDRHALR